MRSSEFGAPEYDNSWGSTGTLSKCTVPVSAAARILFSQKGPTLIPGELAATSATASRSSSSLPACFGTTTLTEIRSIDFDKLQGRLTPVIENPAPSRSSVMVGQRIFPLGSPSAKPEATS